MSTPTDRVREVIAASGLSQGDFAEAVGLDAPKLSKSLSGKRRFSSLDYARIAERGGVTVDWLLTGEETQFAVAARAATGLAPDAALTEAERLAELREVAAELGHPQPLREFVIRERQAQLAGRLPSDSDADRSPGSRGRHASSRIRDRRDAGGETYLAVNAGTGLGARATAHLEACGLSATSVDLAGVVEEAFGVDVAITSLGDGFDGLAVTTDGAAIILAAPTPVWARQRFTIAHELGHVLTADRQELHLDEDIYDRAHRVDPSEVRANAFAAAFLMPETVLRDRVVRGFDELAFAGLAMDLGVSPNALAYRLADLRLIDLMTRDRFRVMTMDAATQATGRSDEVAVRVSSALQPRHPGLLARDLFSAYAAEETTLRPYARLLGVPASDLRASFDADGSED